jgi:O-acetyl-ADP-ribose deacetylase (regulator of RNase III)
LITYVVSDLFQSPARVLVNAVNTVGAMGKGIAYDFRRLYPDMYEQYVALCEGSQFQTGQLWLYKTPHRWILNFPTKQHWRDPSRLEYIEAGLQKFAATYTEKGITSISFPLLGSGLGGLDWDSQVRPLMERYLAALPIDIFIHLYEPDNPFTGEKVDFEVLRGWLHGEPQSITFAHFWNDLAALIGSGQRFETLEDHLGFQATFDGDERRISLTVGKRDALLFSESLLADLWHVVRTAGYCLPQSFPSGLDAHASLIVGLLTKLDYIRPVLVARPQIQREIGLHFFPPADTTIHEPAIEVFES